MTGSADALIELCKRHGVGAAELLRAMLKDAETHRLPNESAEQAFAKAFTRPSPWVPRGNEILVVYNKLENQRQYGSGLCDSRTAIYRMRSTGRELWRRTLKERALTHGPNSGVADTLDEAKGRIPGRGRDRTEHGPGETLMTASSVVFRSCFASGLNAHAGSHACSASVVRADS
jgi:hypothetical protein